LDLPSPHFLLGVEVLEPAGVDILEVGVFDFVGVDG
jgi:hypothetical protein